MTQFRRPDVLILSVGGSPQPLISAIRGLRPRRVHFVVSDGGTGSPSSRGMVEDETICHDRSTDRWGPGLRHLPETPKDIAITGVPADDLGGALARIDAALSAELGDGRTVVIDYTGGTKSMTAAMVLAATAHEGVGLQFMAGERRDLTTVSAGTEVPVPMPGELIGLARLFALTRGFVSRRQYGSALSILRDAGHMLDKVSKGGGVKPPRSWRRRIQGWRQYLEVLNAWDSFDHARARNLLQSGLASGAAWTTPFTARGLDQRLDLLCSTEGQMTSELVEDLWLNALRRANLGLYDDAVARLYRLAEAAVEVRLRDRIGHGTDRVPVSVLPKGFAAPHELRRNDETGEEFVMLGLRRGLELLERESARDALVRDWPRDREGNLAVPEWQVRRNRSILAHGTVALDEQTWAAAMRWFLERRAAMWEDALGRDTAPQLPDELPERV